MEFLNQKAFSLCNIYISLCANKEPTSNTRSAMEDIEKQLQSLASKIMDMENETETETKT